MGSVIFNNPILTLRACKYCMFVVLEDIRVETLTVLSFLTT